VKIGLIESEVILLKVLDVLNKMPGVKIIWDPILKSSTGFEFHNKSFSDEILKRIFLTTPNWNEVVAMGGDADAVKSARNISKYCSVVLKGGHRPDHLGKDILFTNGKEFNFNSKPGIYTPKHGSGCVFSSSLLANLAKGYPLNKAILRTKRYVEHFLNSSKELTGYHHT
jgi:hydroxymethylpyrimidine/phosphomethylpyrimidine kinase